MSANLQDSYGPDLELICGNAVMNMVEGIWWPCLLTDINLKSRRPFTVKFFNEDTICQCRRKDLCAYENSVASSSIGKLRQKRHVSKQLVQKLQDDCEIARLQILARQKSTQSYSPQKSDLAHCPPKDDLNGNTTNENVHESHPQEDRNKSLANDGIITLPTMDDLNTGPLLDCTNKISTKESLNEIPQAENLHESSQTDDINNRTNKDHLNKSYLENVNKILGRYGPNRNPTKDDVIKNPTSRDSNEIPQREIDLSNTPRKDDNTLIDDLNNFSSPDCSLKNKSQFEEAVNNLQPQEIDICSHNYVSDSAEENDIDISSLEAFQQKTDGQSNQNSILSHANSNNSDTDSSMSSSDSEWQQDSSTCSEEIALMDTICIVPRDTACIDEDAEPLHIPEEQRLVPNLAKEDSLSSSSNCAKYTTCHERSHLPPSDETIIRDKKYHGIYIKKVEQSSNKKRKRIFNSYHCCFLCHRLVSNLRKHLYIHKDDKDVQSLMELKDDLKQCMNKQEKMEMDKAVQHMQALLRNRGDHEHNLKVQESGHGELIISRRAENFEAESFGPCPLCLEWIKIEKSATKHQASCPVSQKKLTKGEAIIQSAVLAGRIKPEASKTLIKEAFPIMTRDEETAVAQGDLIIVALGNNWIRRNVGNRLKRKYYTSSHMRGAARLLIELRSRTSEVGPMEFFISPCWFEEVATSALKCCEHAIDDEEDLVHPSAAIKLGYDIGHLSNLKLSLALKTGDKTKKEEASEFITLMKIEWTTRVSRLAHSVLNDRRMLKNVHLPIPSDLYKLSNHIKSKLAELKLEKDNPTQETFRKAISLTQSRLLVYNKRRSGELEAMTLANYWARSQGLDPADEALMSREMNELEKYLVKSQDIIKIRGKVSRIVPVLVPDGTRVALDYITDTNVRTACFIKESNEYVFANTGAAVVRAYECLKTTCGEAKLSCPERITCINMRKYMATMSQVVALKDREMQWLCKHLGHTANIHDIHYRATSGFIERVNIGKLMLMTELNVVSKFSGKKLQDITAEDLLGVAAGNQHVAQAIDEDAPPVHGIEIPNAPEDVEDSDEEDEQPCKKKKKKSNVTRQRWTEEEEKELRLEFRHSFLNGKCPGMKECTTAIIRSRMENGPIQYRHWETIKKKVANMIRKKK